MRGLRGRLLLVGVLGLALALAVGAVALYGVLWYSGLRTLDHDAHATATQIAGLVQADHLPEPIPVTGDQIVQVVDARNRVVSASVNADLLTAMLSPAQRGRAATSPIDVSGSVVGLAGRLRVIAVPISGTTRTVVVAQQLDEVQRSLRLLRNALVVIFPLLLVLLGLITWRAIGATLRPVEELRAGAERISGSGRGGRLPVPGTDDEIGALALTLNSMLDRLAESRERQRAFVADVAHELRSPLTSIRTQLEIAQHLGEGGSLVDDLHADTLRMGSLVEDLLMLARLDADSAPAPNAVRVNMGPLLDDVVARHPDPAVPIVVAPVVDGLAIAADPDEARRIIGNLVENALRFARSRVEVSAVDVPGRGVEIVVEDDGPGIPEADHARVLERFVRLDPARTRAGAHQSPVSGADQGSGTGLGLAIVDGMVRRRGGAVRLESSGAGGLRAVVLLPRWT